MKEHSKKNIGASAISAMIDHLCNEVKEIVKESEAESDKEKMKTILDRHIPPAIQRVQNKRLADILTPLLQDAARLNDKLDHLEQVLRW